MATLGATLIWASLTCLILACLRQLRRAVLPEADEGEGCARLSVVLAARDEAPRIADCLESLLLQDHPDFEVIVVDDRSRDGTAEAARRAAGGDSRVHVLASDPPPAGWQGRLHAQGRGAAAATGDWIFFLGADQRLRSPSFLLSLLAGAALRELDAILVVPFFAGERWWDWWWFPADREQSPSLGLRASEPASLGGVHVAGRSAGAPPSGLRSGRRRRRSRGVRGGGL